MVSVLITDGLLRKSLCATRSLGKLGFDITSMEVASINPVKFSKYNKHFYKTPNPRLEPQKYLEYLIKKLKENKIDVFLPMDDPIMKLCVENQELLAQYSNFAVPDFRNFNLLYDKHLSVEHVKSLDIRCPKTIDTKNVDDLNVLSESLKYPVVIKPKISSGGRGINIVKESKDFIETFKSVHAKFPFPLVQDYVKCKHKFDVCMIYNKENKLRGLFVQKELRNFPIETGPSTFHESVYFENVKNLAIKLMDSIKWCGIVEIEFVVEEGTNDIYFMEANPRFWESLELATISGIDFPKMYCDISLTGDCDFIEYYLVGKRVRNFFPGEILHFIVNKNRFKLSPGVFCPGEKVKDDIFRIGDPLPFIVTILVGIMHFFSSKKRKNYIYRK